MKKQTQQNHLQASVKSFSKLTYCFLALCALDFHSVAHASTLAEVDRYAAETAGKASAKKIAIKTGAATKQPRLIKKNRLSANPSYGEKAGLHATHDPLALKSSVVLVEDETTSDVLFAKNTHAVLPIASITKLMTALVVIEARQPMEEMLQISEEDLDTEKNTRSRLRVGTTLSRADMLHLALMSSENRAASALGRNYPGGIHAFVMAMNEKARWLGMNNSRFVDSSGLNSNNVSSAGDLVRLVKAASAHAEIRNFSTNPNYAVEIAGRQQMFRNTNGLVASSRWSIGVSKTGFINEAGKCLVMQATIEGRQVVIVLLDSIGKYSRLADANRIRKWLEETLPHKLG